ncbi:MAG TPA: transketolase C-terminal domain-containing protein [Trueperaceae bacterium]
MSVISKSFPMDVSKYQPLSLDPSKSSLSAEERRQWETNIGLMRDVIVFFTAVAGARGLSGHTGGAYDVVPEALLADGFMRGSDRVYPVLFDEAGHRVALQYALSAFNGAMAFEELLYYREENKALYGHPEIDEERAIGFASGRLGHLWPFVNGVAMANPDKAVILLGSDGSQMEGNDAEAARLAVAKDLNVKLLLDDNNVTIAGHPDEYLPGFDMTRTLGGHGLTTEAGDGEDLDSVYTRFQRALAHPGPVAVINHRPMAPGLPEIEGKPAGHEVIGADAAKQYLLSRGHEAAARYLEGVTKHEESRRYRGSSDELGSNRKTFGKVVSDLIDEIPEAQRSERIMVIDSDLAGSTGLNTIAKRHPEVFVASGVMERGNFSAAAGFGFEEGRTGVFSTFSAFLEMVVSEVTMARLNRSNVLCHFSHAGVDAIADNTSHFGINIFFADNGVEQQGTTPLYFPADAHQFEAVVKRILWEPGVRFLFSTRSEVPFVLDEEGRGLYDPQRGYTFEPGKDEVVREGNAGWVVSFGEMLYRSLDAVERLRADGLDVGLINKPTINVVDEETMKLLGGSPFVFVVEGLNRKTGLGSRFGSWLLERGYSPRYASAGVTKIGEGGTWAQLGHQGLGSDDLVKRIEALAKG